MGDGVESEPMKVHTLTSSTRLGAMCVQPTKRRRQTKKSFKFLKYCEFGEIATQASNSPFSYVVALFFIGRPNPALASCRIGPKRSGF